MAKKKAATQSTGSKDRTKCIKMVRNTKSGSYYFKEDVIPNEEVENFFKEGNEAKGQEQEASN